MGKESTYNAGDTGDLGSVPESSSREDPLEEGMAIHSSIFAQRIPWIEEPGKLQSLGSQRVGYNWSDWAHNSYILLYNKLPPDLAA